jgi:hypothetical protein
MLVLRNRQRALLADKVPDITGLAVWIAFFVLAVKIAGEGEGK